MLAKELNILFYDREIIAMASEDSGVNEVLFSDERLRPDLRSRLRGLYKGEPVLGYSTPAKGAPRDGELFEYQAAVIRRLAETGPLYHHGPLRTTFWGSAVTWRGFLSMQTRTSVWNRPCWSTL